MYLNVTEKKLSKEIMQIIGAELKRRRLMKAKSLEVHECGCSISYRSKIENGKIIPKMNILQELCISEGISESELENLIIIDDHIHSAIQHLFWNNKNGIAKIYGEVGMFNNYKSIFIKIIYEMTFFHWDKVKQLLDSIYNIRNNFKDNDYYVYNYLVMVLANVEKDYPKVYELYSNFLDCKNDYLLALTSKEKFICVCEYGIENPIFSYEDYNKYYSRLFNYSVGNMYEKMLETLVSLGYKLKESIVNELRPELKLQYYLCNNEFENLDLLLRTYKPSLFEKLLIDTAKSEIAEAEKTYKKLPLIKLPVKDVIIANYCEAINSGDDEYLAEYLIKVAMPYAQKENDGILFKMFLNKLSSIAFSVGKYKAIAKMTLAYFDMLGKCKPCLR